MADAQKTHKPTPKRVREYRKKGQIALSRDVVSAATLLGGAAALVATSGMATGALVDLTRDAALATDGSESLDLAGAAFHAFAAAAGPVMIGAAVAATIAIAGQLGWPPAFKKPAFDLGRMSPLTNLKQTFSLAGMARRSGTAIAKIIVVGAIVYAVLRGGIATHSLDAASLAAVAWLLVRRALFAVLGALAVLAAVDYWFSRRKLLGEMKMSSDEIKREHREQEGDPMLKGRRKQRMRELAKRRVASAVAKATVVVVNPTHYAVALRYDEKTDRAPIVVAKGVDESAEKIRELARKHGVPVLSRPPLTRALYKHVKEGRTIPSNLYRAVAEVLAYVYRIRHGARA